MAGLEKAIREETEVEVELALGRIALIHSVILSVGGIPLIYLGDEVGTLNDYGYRQDPAKVGDSRWAHRPCTDWDEMARRSDATTLEGRVYQRLCRLIEIRKAERALAGSDLHVIDTGNDHVLGYVRQCAGRRMVALANFAEHEQRIAANVARVHGLGYSFKDLVSGETIDLEEELELGPYQFLWLVVSPESGL